MAQMKEQGEEEVILAGAQAGGWGVEGLGRSAGLMDCKDGRGQESLLLAQPLQTPSL